MNIMPINSVLDEKNPKCTIVVPREKVMYTDLQKGIKIATAYTKKTGRETIFAYHDKKRKVMSAITAGNCTYTGEVDMDYLAKMDAGVFHTHSQPPDYDYKLPCVFSSQDLQYFAQENIQEGILGCVDPKSNVIQLTEINLRIPKNTIWEFSDIVREIHENHSENPYPYYPPEYKKLLRTRIIYQK